MTKIKFILIVLVLLGLNSFGQKKYKYIYTFKPSIQDTGSVTIDSSSIEKNYLFVSVENFINEKLSFANVIIQSKDTVIQTTTDIDGNLKINLKTGHYAISINYLRYKPFVKYFKIYAGVKMRIILARGPSLTIYEIHSRVKLKENELDQIKKCIEQNRELKDCGSKNKFYITMQI